MPHAGADVASLTQCGPSPCHSGALCCGGGSLSLVGASGWLFNHENDDPTRLGGGEGLRAGSEEP